MRRLVRVALLLLIVVLSPLLVILLVAGLDARWDWSAGFPLVVELVGLGLIVAGYVLGSWALIENAWFSGTVRVQPERGHEVVSSGPYRWVRHPGYLGTLATAWDCRCCWIRPGPSSRRRRTPR